MKAARIQSSSRGNKFHARKIKTDDGTFDSQKEYRRWGELQLLQRAGYISNLKRQVPYVVIPSSDKFRKTVYIADFEYRDASGATVIEDVKGCKVGPAYELFKLKKKLMYQEHGIEVVEI